MMRAGHIAGSTPLAILGGTFLPAPTTVVDDVAVPALPPAVELVARIAFGLIVVAASSVNDWDHPRFRDRSHPFAALVRWSCRLGYALHTDADRETWERREAWCVRTGRDYDPDDMHRGPSHCLEWCALVAGLVYAVAAWAPLTAPLAWWWGLAVFVSLASHVVLDALTPSGVPISAVWNYVRYRETWRRHAFAWRWRDLGFRSPGHLGGGRFGLVARAVALPLLTVIPVDESADGCRPGLFYTDDAGEHLIAIPLMWLGTSALVGGLTGTLGPFLGFLFNLGGA